MKTLRIITVIVIIIGGIMQIKNFEWSELILILGVMLGIFLEVKNYNEQ